MAKDDIDSFVTDMKTLASILGHNDDVVMEKFKDIFPDKNIKVALIGMNNFNNMQAKAKQLVQIYRPNYTNDSSSLGASLIHTHKGDTPSVKSKVAKSKVTNQHQLAPTQNTGPSKQGRVNNRYHITETVKILELPNRLNIYVSYVEIEVIMTINVNLQLILFNKCRKCSNALIICMTLTRIRNGLKVMTTMIKNSLFNKGGSWCH